MKKSIHLILLLFLSSTACLAQWPEGVTTIESKVNDSVAVDGDLSTGKTMEDLSWASNSANACFVATQNIKYRGSHVFFATSIPPHSILNISVKPRDEAADLSIYAYMMGTDDHYLVPDLPRCITCEADFKWDGNWKNRVQTSERKVEFNNPTDHTYNILIGVSAPRGVTSGAFTVMVKVRG
jgi:hypothetical protein